MKCSHGSNLKTDCFDCRKDQRLKYKYNISLDEFKDLLDKQENKCAICRVEFDDNYGPRVDHDHVSGEARQLLCARCNYVIGLIEDNHIWAQKVADYLKKHSPTVLGNIVQRGEESKWWNYNQMYINKLVNSDRLMIKRELSNSGINMAERVLWEKLLQKELTEPNPNDILK